MFLWGCTQTDKTIDKPTWLYSLRLGGGNYWSVLKQLLDDDVDVSLVTLLAVCVFSPNITEACWLQYQSIFTLSRRSYAIVAVCLSVIRSVVLSVCLSVCMFVCLSVSRITQERVYGCQPNVVGVDKGWLARSGWILLLIRIRVWISHHFSISLTIAK